MRLYAVLAVAGSPDTNGNVHSAEALRAIAEKHPLLEYDDATRRLSARIEGEFRERDDETMGELTARITKSVLE